MIYLSRLVLNPRSRQVQSELERPYEMHRTLSHAFGASSDEQAAARCLFRVEQQGCETVLLVQSKTEPNWSRVEHESSRDVPYTCSSVYKAIEPKVHNGQYFLFRLLANPTITRQGQRYGLYSEDERLAWFKRKAEANGFIDLDIVYTNQSQVKGNQRENPKQVKLSAALYEGSIQVTDADKLIYALENGIGAGKGFGFGLLSLRRL